MAFSLPRKPLRKSQQHATHLSCLRKTAFICLLKTLHRPFSLTTSIIEEKFDLEIFEIQTGSQSCALASAHLPCLRKITTEFIQKSYGTVRQPR
jgi:hypothetical protein